MTSEETMSASRKNSPVSVPWNPGGHMLTDSPPEYFRCCFQYVGCLVCWNLGAVGILANWDCVRMECRQTPPHPAKLSHPGWDESTASDIVRPQWIPVFTPPLSGCIYFYILYIDSFDSNGHVIVISNGINMTSH